MSKRSMAAILVSLALSAACSDSGEPGAAVTVLRGVSVVDVRTGNVATDRTIVIRHGRIESVGAEPDAGIPANAAVYEKHGSFVVPGFWDMHVHFRGGSELTEENAVLLRQYLGFGVTAVRDAGGDLSDAVRRWRDEVDRGMRAGPKIFTSLQKLDGPEGGWPGSIRLSVAADVAPAIDTLEQSGADFVKLYDGSLDGATYLEAIAEADRRGLKSAGHMPLTVMFDDAIAAGLDSVEHELYLAKAASGDEAVIAAEIAILFEQGESVPFIGTLKRLQTSYDPGKLARTFDLMIERRAALTPTLYIGRVLDTMTDPAIYENDPGYLEVPPGIRATFRDRVGRLLERSPEAIAMTLAVMEANRTYVKSAAERGVTILAGSDTGAVNSFLFAGDSLHRELEELVDAGLPPLQALQAATLHAAEWLDEAADHGTVEAGKAADLVILDANPLEDIRNTRSISGVVRSGTYLDRPALEALRRLEE